MAPKLRLPDNFRVCTFGPSRNVNGIGKYLMSNPGAPHVAEVTHVSETQCSQSLLRPFGNPPSEDSMLSPWVPNPASDALSDGERCVMGRRKRCKTARAPRKRKKTAPETITRRWQEVWACKFAWVEAEYDSNGHLSGVVCQSCTAITGRRKVLVPKANNLEKHEGKRICLEDGVPFLNLMKGDTFINTNCKHVKLCKLWAAHKNASTVADQLTAGMESDFKRKGTCNNTYQNPTLKEYCCCTATVLQ